MEAIDAGITRIFIRAERVPLHDTVEMMDAADERGVTIVGPDTPGIASPGRYRLGGPGGSRDDARDIFKRGHVGVVSRSGGMTSTLSYILSHAGIGQSSACGGGGDAFVGTPSARGRLQGRAAGPGRRAGRSDRGSPAGATADRREEVSLCFVRSRLVRFVDATVHDLRRRRRRGWRGGRHGARRRA